MEEPKSPLENEVNEMMKLVSNKKIDEARHKMEEIYENFDRITYKNDYEQYDDYFKLTQYEIDKKYICDGVDELLDPNNNFI